MGEPVNIKLLIGKRIAEGRSALGLSQVELSAVTGFGKTRISNWETGFRTPKLEDAKTLEKCLNIPAPYLLCLTDSQEFTDETGKNQRVFKSIPIFTEAELLKMEQVAQLDQHVAENYLPLIKSNEILVDQGAFAFRLHDNSMSPEFNKNDLVVLNPNAKLRHNDTILVKVRGTNEIVFRKYFLDNVNINKPIIKLIPNDSNWLVHSTENQSDLLIFGVLSTLQRLFT